MSSNALYRLVTLVAVVVPANFMGAEPLKKFSLVYNVNNAGYVDVCGCKADCEGQMCAMIAAKGAANCAAAPFPSTRPCTSATTTGNLRTC